MLLKYKLHKVKNKVETTTDLICDTLGTFNSFGTISLQLSPNHILKVRNYVLGHYLNSTALFSRLYANKKILDGIVNVFTPMGQNISKTIFKNELLLLKEEFVEYERAKEKGGGSFESSDLLLNYLDNLAYEQNKNTKIKEARGLISDVECDIPDNLVYDSVDDGTLGDLFCLYLSRLEFETPVIG